MPAAGKTGTTSSEYDLWFAGYTPYLTASIWTGYDENKSLSGDQAFHERLWSKIMSRIDEVKNYKKKDFKRGKNVHSVEICDSSGKVAIKGVCPKTHTEYYKSGSEPGKCNWHSGNYSNNYDYTKNSRENTTTKANSNGVTKKSSSESTTQKIKSGNDEPTQKPAQTKKVPENNKKQSTPENQ